MAFAAGEIVHTLQFWLSAAAAASAKMATLAGEASTYARKRGWAIWVEFGTIAASSSSNSAASGRPSSGSGSRRMSSITRRSSAGNTGREARSCS
jgi:hypothetical protein